MAKHYTSAASGYAHVIFHEERMKHLQLRQMKFHFHPQQTAVQRYKNPGDRFAHRDFHFFLGCTADN